MAQVKKLGRATDQRMAVMRNQVSYLLWHDRIETQTEKAKAVRSAAEKLITLAMNTYTDTVKVEKEVLNDKGEKVKKEFINDGPKKLAARRKIMAFCYKIPETRGEDETKASFNARVKGINHPLIEKIFNVLAPKYAKRKEELGQGGGYTRVIKTRVRRGDNAEMAIVELV